MGISRLSSRKITFLKEEITLLAIIIHDEQKHKNTCMGGWGEGGASL